MVCASLFGARTPLTTVLVAAFGSVTGICSTLAAAGRPGPCRFAAGIEQHDPGPRVATNDSFDALAIVPPRCAQFAVDGFKRSDVRIHASVQTMRHSRQNAHET